MEVYVHNFVPVWLRHIGKVRVNGDASVVKDQINLAVLGNHFLWEGFDCFCITDIARALIPRRCSFEHTSRARKSVLVDIANHDVAA